MKTLLRNAIFAAFGLFLLQGSAFAAQWSNVPGTAAVIESPGNTTNSAKGSAAVYYKSSSLDFVQKAKTDNYLYTWIPNQALQQIAFIYVRYYKQYAGAKLDTVYLYDGNTMIKTILAPINTPAGWVEFIVPLNGGNFVSVLNGIGVSLHVVADTVNTQFILSDVSGYVQ